MLDRLRGKLVDRTPTQVVVEVGGLGLAVDVPLSTFERLPMSGHEVELLCHLVISSQGQGVRLFGFATSTERQLFRMLLTVSGVGPAMALSVLSGSSVRAVAQAIRAEDVTLLQRIKRVGPKTARRIVVDLKERVEELGLEAAGVVSRDPVLGDTIAALVSLGYTRGEAETAATKARQAVPDASVETLVRESLRRL